MKSLKQRKTLNITDIDAAPRFDNPENIPYDSQEILHIGEILDDRVDNHGIKGSVGNSFAVIRGALLHCDMGKALPCRGNFFAKLINCERCKICRKIIFTFRRDTKQQLTGTTPDFHNPPGAKVQNATNGLLLELLYCSIIRSDTS